jgi:hypothetical protein
MQTNTHARPVFTYTIGENKKSRGLYLFLRFDLCLKKKEGKPNLSKENKSMKDHSEAGPEWPLRG